MVLISTIIGNCTLIGLTAVKSHATVSLVMHVIFRFLLFGAQGIPLKIPMIDKKYLDLYTLHKVRST